MELARFVAEYIAALGACLEAVDVERLQDAARLLQRARRRGATAYVLGNGGSAATASHLAADLGRPWDTDPPLRVVCLSDSVAALTAAANDTSYADAFAELLAPRVRPGDVVIAVSGSGRSANVVRGARAARARGATVLALVGFGGGELAAEADLALVTEARHYGVVEDLHGVLGHLLAMILAGPLRMQDPGARPPSALPPRGGER